MSTQQPASISTIRLKVMTALFAAIATLLVWRAVDLQLLTRDFLQEHGDARHLRVVKVPAHRSMITDRSGEPLAISTPVKSIWGIPAQLLTSRSRWPELAALLETSVDQLDALITPRQYREFIYLKRHVSPDFAARVIDLGIDGVATLDEYRRYYPAGEITAHLVGFTNVDDEGQEGIELAFNEQLRGTSGAKRVIRDRLGRVIEDVEQISAAISGTPLTLSIDRRLQYIAYRELKSAVQRHRARAGSVVIIDPYSGEVLAIANQPSFNPNNRSALKSEHYRNRAITDLFEPGSTIKPFTIAAALESGLYTADSVVQTAPGFFKVGRDTVRDINNYGSLDLSGILQKSSNVGAAKIALSMDAEILWRMMQRLGFGAPPGSGFPGEVGGWLNDFRNLREIEQATLAFGYGLSVTTLHLARAWGVLADDGVMHETSLLRRTTADPGTRVMSVATARMIREMLIDTIDTGTGSSAKVPGFQVAGKTGTVHKATTEGYAEDRYASLFAGIIPATAPRLVAAIVIDEPQAGEHFGGRVAAPIFASIMTEAVRILNIAGDAEPPLAPTQLANRGTLSHPAVAEPWQ